MNSRIMTAASAGAYMPSVTAAVAVKCSGVRPSCRASLMVGPSRAAQIAQAKP
jgi:hypothetical protein